MINCSVSFTELKDVLLTVSKTMPKINATTVNHCKSYQHKEKKIKIHIDVHIHKEIINRANQLVKSRIQLKLEESSIFL